MAELHCVQRLSWVWGSAQKMQVVDGVCHVRPSYILALVLCPDAFEIRRLSSVFLRVKTNVGVQVLYDREGLRLYLQVDQRWVEDTVGLCGTFNGNTQDDFLYVPPHPPTPHKQGQVCGVRFSLSDMKRVRVGQAHCVAPSPFEAY